MQSIVQKQYTLHVPVYGTFVRIAFSSNDCLDEAALIMHRHAWPIAVRIHNKLDEGT